MTYWRTYTGTQARQVWSGLQILLQDKLLASDEEELVKKIQAKLRGSMWKGEGYSQISFTKDEDEFLTRVEVSLWK